LEQVLNGIGQPSAPVRADAGKAPGGGGLHIGQADHGQQVLRAQLAGGVQRALVVQAQVVAKPEQHRAHGCAPVLPAVGAALRWRRQRSEQYFTSSHTLAHFLRQVKGRPQHWQGFSGR